MIGCLIIVIGFLIYGAFLALCAYLLVIGIGSLIALALIGAGIFIAGYIIILIIGACINAYENHLKGKSSTERLKSKRILDAKAKKIVWITIIVVVALWLIYYFTN